MVRRRLTPGSSGILLAALAGVVVTAAACARERDMRESVEMADSMSVVRALENPAMGDSMLDTLPGGEMVRGDSAAMERLLRDKIER